MHADQCVLSEKTWTLVKHNESYKESLQKVLIENRNRYSR